MPPSPPGRFRWIGATVLLVAGITANVSLDVLPHDVPLWNRMLLAVSIGLLTGMALYTFSRTLHDQRYWQAARHLPRSIHMEQQDDGRIIAFVEQLDGEPRIVTLPEGYDPREDDGRRLFELLSQPE